MNESALRRALLVIAILGLAIGLWIRQFGFGSIEAGTVWTVATLPVVVALAISILRDFWIGRFGVDAIALVSMSAALLLDQPLAAVVVAIMYAGGTVLEDFARGRAERNLKALTDRAPRVAHRKSAQSTDTISVDQVSVGEELLVRTGELLPVDGILLDASASVDESAVTGEPLPVRRSAGDALRSGTLNAGEPFSMRASALAEQSTYAAIVRMVATAQTAKAPFIRMADRFALFLLPATLLVSGTAWYASGDPIRALAVLVVATPCPLILAAPVAFIGGVSRAARAGILMKGSAALEALAQARTAIFDKTGTLTIGGAELVEIDVAPGDEADQLLQSLASLEQASHHVLADSIIRAARGRQLMLSHPHGVHEYRGAGLKGQVGNVSVLAGSRMLVLAGRPLPRWTLCGEEQYRNEPVLRVFVAFDGRLAGVFTFGDALRADARDALGTLRSAGIERMVMLTGDDGAAAERVSALLGLDAVIADATPAKKVATVEAEKALAPTMMVGDGVNDAPALAAATVGIALGARGATASSAAADIVVLTDRLQPVAEAVEIARRTRTIALQSIIVGLALSGMAMAAAAMGQITPVAGALLQEGIDVAVILNALRALGNGHLGRR
ncbi:heavy metal translocating P-type ATPase [Mesorhizobium sp. M4B.F.Ca.ET.215.01.1.1]|uniref:heavy metal translocating P-type ATPase n=1 Tax=unclassified Mesorhizobium TaxID=325217 RepID=UPI000FCA5082|nr:MULTISPECIES: heavy metal translocating P-type ATPase [unclassified Mesorhizobium]RUW27749.1 heavy metal translocating P-type ATPase [Mesorhizobium sp. M4B.F.Ca.ET.013.02.1.1]RVD35482.1 heavy metal translocating P-type ATPase [Mesorhizobium sp. M4B.F.Ca.ET.019.03.1.1]RWF67760.1 MAG: heavy metal translocating P-type ATPase [Mesorhizobium sp.]TGQ18453.1 heavy metal translocating P-type ATPase [Mesorhizobium sp. M4B.F.Ca.ET.215.01.1.1]TGQ49291.1 heavy metal translocating P-type ATPase [Mesorhi